MMKAIIEKIEKLKARGEAMVEDQRGDMGMVNAGIYLVVLLVVLYVGISIISNVITADSLSATDNLYQSQLDLINTTESSYGMAGIMPIVMIAVAVLTGLLGVLYMFSQKN